MKELPAMPHGMELHPVDEVLTGHCMWSYPGATTWLRTKYAGEKPTLPGLTGNVYVRPAWDRL